MSPVTRILVPVDFDEASTSALAYAKTLADSLHASISLLHVVPSPYISDPAEAAIRSRGVDPSFFEALVDDARQKLDDVMAADDRQRFHVRQAVKLGDPRVIIPEYAVDEPVDLIVMATHGRGGVAHFFLGSVTERVVRTAPCPVLVVRPGASKAQG